MVSSHGKDARERSMNRQFKARFEQSLKAMEASMHRKHGLRIYDKVPERIGRAGQKYPTIQKHYEINVEKQDGDETAAGINRKIREGKETDASSGVYYLRTSRMGLSKEAVWKYYNRHYVSINL